ncbi:hypothetical protein KUCAC02_031149 [Chaenocephalus aceratus]|uniref:Uncharacterized protein n=1 Tax=Chaenocephalus aceratus TaxID=36190 RepID=A0ACB9XMC5_CHAAC|nr:hypothetical protein KUCAC02_031149 [Chaenocephalus aceratus]
MRLLLLLAAIAAVSQAQTDCSQGACYPPSNDLLLGRSHQLHASSTCGLTGSEVYCTPYEQRRMKCCPCDSTNPNARLAHTVRDVLSTAEPQRWWQSKKEVAPVTLQLDLGNLFQLDHLQLSFKGPRPNAFVIERTLDDGRGWQPALYLATDCATSFPGIPTATPLTLEHTYCYTLPPTGSSPYQDHTIQYSPLRQYAYVPASKSQKIEDVSGVDGAEGEAHGAGRCPRLPGRALSRFYALKEMRVVGSCMCHGHASRCLPEAHSSPQARAYSDPFSLCLQHHTAGVNCERCEDLYNDRPWSPAEEGDTHACQRCECNSHAQRCRFDPAVYEASGWKSGGYQPNPRSHVDRPDACLRCVCSAEGTVNGGRCDDSTGLCQCKLNVEGPRCDRCRRGYYGLSPSSPLGCSKCSCSVDGSLTEVTGNPLCPDAAPPCNCDPTRSYSDTCDQVSGQCQCRPGFGGRGCTECPDNTYGDALIGCKPCRCDRSVSVPAGVTVVPLRLLQSGTLRLLPGLHHMSLCFFTLDAQRQNLSSALGRLSPSIPTRPGGSDRRSSVQAGQAQGPGGQVNNELSPKERPPALGSELDRLQALLDSLTLQYKAKKDCKGQLRQSKQFRSFFLPSRTPTMSSTDAAQKVDDSKTPAMNQLISGKETNDIPRPNTASQHQRHSLPTGPSLLLPDRYVAVAKSVWAPCRSARGADADVKDVKERLDRLSGKITDAAEKLQDAQENTNQVRLTAEKLSNQMKQAREGLEDDLKETRDVVKDLKDFPISARLTHFIGAKAAAYSTLSSNIELDSRCDCRRLRLSWSSTNWQVISVVLCADPSSNLTHIQEVSDWILKAKRRSHSGDSQETAAEAKDARDTALGVKDGVDNLLGGIVSEEGSLADLDVKLQNSMDLIENLSDSLNKTREQLTPAENTLEDVSELITPMKPQLDELKELLKNGGQLAEDAQDGAEKAQDEADAAEEDLVPLEEKLQQLKDKAAAKGPEGGAGPLGDRLAKLKQDAGDLANTTDTMTEALEGKAESLRLLQGEVLQKSSQLEGLDVTLKDLLEKLRRKSDICHG